ncbi:DGQHR domain-containing protein DpdB [Azospirillum isscasi]|uniref:DGQHR domain-containing protein DpdB n=1 Tax=Azospirillum isscasi TaxID=3053926 RepID=A0ABU0WDC2_9PROT|nr:DGQHR domain-containing protein DpdB [Azospirillum isscasi]MDQ2102181.1 DGQHR domain-containing protein DpdB [Azospirillum isscasi]
MLTFAASATDVLGFASIDRIARDADGRLSGFQRPQVAGHIREIRDYLEKPGAVLPNPIVVAFTRGVDVQETGRGICRVTIDTTAGPPGLVVDGQQRLSALRQLPNKDFQVFVSALVCRDEAELRRQFVLINNTRPLPKSLIYELLPTVDELPERLGGRSAAAAMTARLNHDKRSPFQGRIHQHTNPAGTITDTAVQKVVLNSLNDGVMREFMRQPDGEEKCFRLVCEFYHAVKSVFPESWWDHKPTTSRLVHGAGIQAMGYVMEVLALLDGARSWDEFARGMECLKGRTAWTEGHWDFGNGDVRHWKAVQNVNRDVVTLAQYLIGIVRADIKARKAAPAGPLFAGTGG